MHRLTLIGCSEAKRDHACAAADLYTSQLFRACRAYAMTRGDWGILSACFGIVWPEQVITPYDVKLRATKDHRVAFRHRVSTELRNWAFRRNDIPLTKNAAGHNVLAEPVQIEVLAGAEYARGVRAAWGDSVTIVEPMKGLGVGERLRWLKCQPGGSVNVAAVDRKSVV